MIEILDDEVEHMTAGTFSMSLIEDSIFNGINIIDTVVSYCEENNLHMEDIIPLLDQNIKDRIMVCGVDERYVIKDEALNKNKLF